jgi:hypothetical protein
MRSETGPAGSGKGKRNYGYDLDDNVQDIVHKKNVQNIVHSNISLYFNNYFLN